MDGDGPEAMQTPVDCSECGAGYPLADWLSDPRCPDCEAEHVLPKLPLAIEAARTGELEGASLQDVVDAFHLSDDAATDLLHALGCRAEAALDVRRVVLDGRVRSEWRRLVERTRERERSNYAHVQEVLSEYGVEFEPPDDG